MLGADCEGGQERMGEEERGRSRERMHGDDETMGSCCTSSQLGYKDWTRRSDHG